MVLCGVLVWFLADAARVRAAAAEALALCGRSVVPALFPFMAVSALLVAMGFGEWMSPHLAGLMSLFRLPGPAGSALLLGLVGGYPVGARTAAELFHKGLLTEEEAERLLGFCNNSNPVFLVSVLGSGVFGSVRAGVWLWLIHVLSALLTGLFFRGEKTRRKRGPVPEIRETPVFQTAFVEAVQRSSRTMLSVCGFVVLFYVLASPLSALGGYAGAALVGCVELFSLTPLLPPDRLGFLLAAGCAGWGGISILCQTAAVWAFSGLRVRNCFFGKILQGGISILLAAGVCAFFQPV